MLKIAFDSQLFLKGKKTGIAWCGDHIIKELAKDPKYTCLCDFFSLHYPEEKKREVEKYQDYGVQMNPCSWFHDVLYKMIWPILPVSYHWFFGSDRDVTLFFNFIIPPGVKGKRIAVVHDMAYKAYPETVNKKTLKWLQLTLKKSCRRADAIITVSEFSKQEIVKYLGVPKEKIIVMANGVDLDIFHPDYGKEEVTALKEIFQIQGEYFLYLGTLEPRKNIERLVRAYAQMLEEWSREGILREPPKLVLAGGKGWLYDSIFETVREFGLDSQVVFTGYVEESQVPVLMKGARAFVFPSLYEGFGMPPLEAMACGTPVLTSTAASLPEVVGETGILVDPESIEDICHGLKRLAKDDELCRKLQEAGPVRAREFSWDKTVRPLKELLGRMEK